MAKLTEGRARKTILLVEDAGVVRPLVRNLLEHEGYQVLEARDSVEALVISAGHKGPISLLLTDIGLPGMNGYVLARRIRETRPDIRTIYMSGYPGVDLGAPEGGAAYIEKPFQPKDLAALVRRIVNE